MPIKNTREVPVGPPLPARNRAAGETTSAASSEAAAGDTPAGGPAAPEAAQTTSGVAEAPNRASGPDVIAGYLRTLPASPGVYRMIDAAGDVIYVGKARSLKARVTNYTRIAGQPNRIARMIMATVAMEFVTVRTEAEALLLEANLIKRFKPRFNVLLRDDKSFPYILIRRDAAAPQILKHRGARSTKGDYFGPFASAGAVNRTITMLQRAFLLRSCSDAVYDSRTRPCLLFQIKRCSAPCTGEIAPEDYGRLVDEAVRFLRGESQNVRQMYQRLMQEASERLEFETAAKYRNRLWALAHVTSDQSINLDGIEEADVFAAHQDGGITCIQVFFFRSGQNWGNRAYFPRADRTLPVDEVLDAFIAQFYDDKPVPRLILLSHDVPSRALLEEALSTKAERRVEIRVPQRGTKTDIVDHAAQNAREALGRRLAESSSQRTLLHGVAERFGLANAPRRIEVFDNSHIQGAHPVGAMIVAGADGFVKNQYRKFDIKTDIAAGDDYAMMREVLTRRFRRLAVLEEAPVSTEVSSNAAASALEPMPGQCAPLAAPLASGTPLEAAGTRITAPRPPTGARGADAIAFGVLRADNAGEDKAPDEGGDEGGVVEDAFPDVPDLVLIDGGAGQIAVACEVMANLGLAGIPVIGVAKGPDRDAGREHFHIPGRPRPLMLEPRDPVLYFIQRLRDEAHRFVIGTHRAKRAKAIGVNPLDEIAGIGPTRKRALLQHFGSAKAVSRAGTEDLKAVEGISAEMARKIYDFFHERSG